MENLITYGLSVFMGFFAIMNPISNTPIFLGLVEGENKERKKKIARTASITILYSCCFYYCWKIYI